MPAATSPVALGTRGLAALVIAGLLLFAHQAGGVFADEPDEELPPGTITNFRADSQPPRDVYLTWDLPDPVPIDYEMKTRDLSPGPDEDPVSKFHVSDGRATSLILKGYGRGKYSFWMRPRYGPKPRLWYGPWVGIRRFSAHDDNVGSGSLTDYTPRIGHQVTASFWDGDGPLREITWQWSRAGSEDDEYTDIAGATQAVYIPTEADLGKYLKASVTYKDRFVREEFPGHTGPKTVSIKPRDPVTRYTQTLGSSRDVGLGYRNLGSPGLSQPFSTGPHPEGYLIDEVELNFLLTPPYDPEEFEVKVTNAIDVTEESEVFTFINPDEIGEGHVQFQAPLGARLEPNSLYYLAIIHHDSITTSYYNATCKGGFSSDGERFAPSRYGGTGWGIGTESPEGVYAIWLDEQHRGVDVYSLKSLLEPYLPATSGSPGSRTAGCPI